MSLIPWRGKPVAGRRGEFSPLVALRGEMDRLFDTFLREPFGVDIELLDGLAQIVGDRQDLDHGEADPLGL